MRLDQDTVWLNRRQMAQLFGRDIKTIGKHIANSLREDLAVFSVQNGEAVPTVAKFATVQNEGGRQVVRFGASLKDLGKKCFGFTEMDPGEIPGILARV